MRPYLTILLLTTIVSFGFAQVPTTKKVDIVSKTGQKLSFSEIKIESENNEAYKTLELRYQKLTSPDQKDIVVDGTTYKCFPDKKEAIKFYYLIKKNAPQVVVYYVFSLEAKKPEVFTFRISE